MDKIVIVDEERRLARRIQPEEEQPAWYAMSAPYCRELKAREALSGFNVECWVPMRYEVVKRGRIKQRMLVPVLHNLIFVFDRRSRIDEVKRRIGYLQYRTMVNEGKNVPIVVPASQMADFRRVCESENDKVRVLLPGSVSLEKGTKVRIISGEFEGVEGTFVRLAGGRGRRVMVEIPFVASVVTATISPDFIEIADKDAAPAAQQQHAGLPEQNR